MEFALVIAGLATIYLIACAIWPYTACPRCAGGKKYDPAGTSWRNCRRCGGTGKRRRAGSWLLSTGSK